MNHNILKHASNFSIDFNWLIICIAELHFIAAHLPYSKFPSAWYIDIFLFRTFNANSWLGPWIGLSKSEDKCPSGYSGFECERRGWRWEDDTPYLYPSWHKWWKSSPSRQELCAGLHSDDGTWFSRECSNRLPYVCEKGMIFSMFKHCCIVYFDDPF